MTIEEIKKRRAAITPGTWAVEITSGEPFRTRNVMFSAAESETSGVVGFICWRDDTGERVERDFDFIANAPKDIDFLLWRDELQQQQLEDVIQTAKEVLPDLQITLAEHAVWVMSNEINRLRGELKQAQETSDYWRKLYAGTLGIVPEK